jgi:hypothetical protein
MPALPLDEAGKYVAGAYIVFMVLLVVYVAIMAIKLQRIERELRDLAGFAEQRNTPGIPGREAVDGPADSGAQRVEFEETEAAPGRGSEDQSISVSSGPSERGGGV